MAPGWVTAPYGSDSLTLQPYLALLDDKGKIVRPFDIPH